MFFRSPDLKWHSQIDALSFSLRSRGLHAFISSFLPSSKERNKLAPSMVGLSGYHPEQSEGQMTPCPLWLHHFFLQRLCVNDEFCLIQVLSVYSGVFSSSQAALLTQMKEQSWMTLLVLESDVNISWCLIQATLISLQSLRKFFSLILLIFY